LAACKNAFRLPALEELAKYYEHRERNFSMALEMTRRAIEISRTARPSQTAPNGFPHDRRSASYTPREAVPELHGGAHHSLSALERREARLEQRLSASGPGSLLTTAGKNEKED